MTWKQIRFFMKNITARMQVLSKVKLYILGPTLAFLIYKIWRKDKKIKELQEKLEKSGQEKELQKELGILQNETGILQSEIDRRKSQFKHAWRNAPLYPDWRKEEFKTANVTLDAETAHPALLLSEEGRRVSWQETCQDLPSSPQRFDSIPCVLGDKRFSSERYFWKVEVENARSWDLGVCRDNVTRTGRVTVSPQNGFWAIRFYEGEYWALNSPETHLTLREKPFIVGVFLDYEAGDVSFYNMTDGSHIFTFPQNTFYGVLRPRFRLWSSESGSLTICPSE
ncbi:butyrophilin subfamily 1 member A1-like isoform X2 [Cervus canadensis]|uniref:butyrophilin subfamily 1 member A1-like isoform X2 n=1 Tax=Cervus canadensis TaxID=1574408 RepID=UPI001CA36E9C|nr:butyrophilin subfamily 1 member A1-like isoform X2 [Cervus canadensis]